MYTKYVFVAIFGFAFLLSGCETAKGIKKDVDGVPQRVANTWHHANKGAAYTWEKAQKADQWIEENLW